MTGEHRSDAEDPGGLLALVNGRIHTLDPQFPRAQALLVKDGRVAAVGTDREILRQRPSGCPVVDLEARAVTPGLTDAHCHLLQYGFSQLAVDLYGVTSLQELLRRVAHAAADLPPGHWVLGRGWDQDRLAEARWPTRDDLDAVVADRPVLLRRVCGHAAVANSRALELAGIDATTPDPEQGVIERQSDGRTPNGVLHEAAIRLVDRVVPPPDRAGRRRALEAAIRRAHAAGLVGVHTQDVWDEGQVLEILELYRELRAEGLPLRVDLLVGHRALDELLHLGLRTGSGDAFVRIG
ncbi:MAG TPA: amidohydrolase family protein, partial [Bacillota bacterium]